MKVSPIASTSTLSHAVRAPRRRHRSRSHLGATPPSQDLIGPPCPLSNLRPVYYAPMFPELHSPPSLARNLHPYRLQEFGTSNESATLDPRQQRLQALKRQFHAADLEWRLTRYRVDQFNQDFWARTNTEFLNARNAYVAQLPRHGSPDNNEAGQIASAPTDVDLAPFYAQHLASTKKLYAAYNAQLWKMQAALLWPAISASIRRWKWRWEVWKAGGERA